jgi:hypothetical protein
MSETDDIRAKAQEVLRLVEAWLHSPEPLSPVRHIGDMNALAPDLARLDEPRGATVAHEEAREHLGRMRLGGEAGRTSYELVVDYIAQQAERDRAHAELERRARELCAELTEYRSRHQLIAYATNVTRAHDALAELLGERSDSSEGGRG